MYELFYVINYQATIKDYILLLRKVTPDPVFHKGILLDMADKYKCHIIDAIRKADYEWIVRTQPMWFEFLLYIYSFGFDKDANKKARFKHYCIRTNGRYKLIERRQHRDYLRKKYTYINCPY